MSGILPIRRLMRAKTIAQDAPGTIFSRGWLLWYPPFSSTRMLRDDFRDAR